jgi:hypothetical protein
MKILKVLGVAAVVGVFGACVVWAEGVSEEMEQPKLVISAVNAGYTSGEAQQNYDFVEIYNTVGEPLLMDEYKLIYVNSAGSLAGSLEFAAGTILNTEYLVVGYARSPQYAGMGEEYLYSFGGSTGLASTAGSLRLYHGEEVLDEVCWGSAVCGQNLSRFATGEVENMTARRCVVDGLLERCVNGEVFQYEKYYPEINEMALILPEVEKAVAKCFGLVFSEVYSYFEVDYAEQFVELYNPTDEVIELDGCGVGYKNKVYALSGELAPEEYLAYRHEGLRLTKNPGSNNEILLVDADKSVATRVVYYSGQKKGTAWAYFGILSEGLDEGVKAWRQTYAVTEGAENIYQEFKSCTVGKVINPKTGNCINFYEDEELPPCPVGKFRNPETNRCKSYESLDSVLKPCEEGYFRNPETNRCKKMSVVEGPGPCNDGYERNPETNRCRKIRENNGADFGVVGGGTTGEGNWVGYGALAAVVIAGLGYVGWQFRGEAKRGIMKIVRIKSNENIRN